MPDDTTVPVLERLEHLLATTGAHLQSLKRLGSDRQQNSRVRDLLEKKIAFENKKSSDQLTLEEETLIAGKSHWSCIDEQKRIAQELDRIAEEVRPGLLREVWPLLPALEIDYPKTRGFGRRFRELLNDIPDDRMETEWLSFLLDLDSLLRDAHSKVSASRSLAQGTARRSRATNTAPYGPRSIHSPPAAAKLKAFMLEHGLNQRELQERMSRVSTKTISKFLNRAVAIPSVLDEIAITMGTTKDKLLSDE